MIPNIRYIVTMGNGTLNVGDEILISADGHLVLLCDGLDGGLIKDNAEDILIGVTVAPGYGLDQGKPEESTTRI